MVANRQSDTLGIAAARSRSIAPRCRRNRQIERKALTMPCAYRGLIVRACGAKIRPTADLSVNWPIDVVGGRVRLRNRSSM
jgi:hypothetical protein